MTDLRTVLVVASSPELTRRLERTLCTGVWQPTFVTTFAAAKRCLETAKRPDLLISEIKLGEYNGLHLAVRSLAVGIPAITIGDVGFVRDAEQIGALWLSPKEASGERLFATMARAAGPLSGDRNAFQGYGNGMADVTADAEVGTTNLTGTILH